MPERGTVAYRRHDQHRKRERCDDHHSDDERSPRRIKQAGNGRDPKSGEREREQRADHVTPFAIACLTHGFESALRIRESAILETCPVDTVPSPATVASRFCTNCRSDHSGPSPNCASPRAFMPTPFASTCSDWSTAVMWSSSARTPEPGAPPHAVQPLRECAPGASSPIARARVRDAAERGDLMRRVLPGESGNLEADAQHQIDAIVDDLVDAGFEPLVDEDDLTIDLTPCPHASDPADQRATLCSVHLGIMQSVLFGTEANGPLRVEGTAPTCNPAQCVVTLCAKTQRLSPR